MSQKGRTVAEKTGLLRQRADQRALAEVAVDLLRAGSGGRMTTTVQLQQRLDVGSGTVQKVIRHLVDIGAVELQVMGHKGTIIRELDPALVWRSSDLAPLRMMMPPPGSIEATAIALGVRDQFSARGLSLEFDFVRGASRRMRQLDELATPAVVLVSKRAAEALGHLDPAHYSWVDLGPESYYQSDSLVVLRRPRTRRRLRVARDPESPDHSIFTELAFAGEDVTFVNCSFVDVPGALLDDVADAGVWHQVLTTITPQQAGLLVEPWRPKTDVDLTDVANALLLWRAEFGEVGALLSTVAVEPIVARMQDLVALGVNSDAVRESVPWL